MYISMPLGPGRYEVPLPDSQLRPGKLDARPSYLVAHLHCISPSPSSTRSDLSCGTTSPAGICPHRVCSATNRCCGSRSPNPFPNRPPLLRPRRWRIDWSPASLGAATMVAAFNPGRDRGVLSLIQLPHSRFAGGRGANRGRCVHFSTLHWKRYWLVVGGHRQSSPGGCRRPRRAVGDVSLGLVRTR